MNKIDTWLAEEVGIGGDSKRGFDPTSLIEFAWRLQLEELAGDEIYFAFAETQQESMKLRMASELGLEALGLQQLTQTAAMDLDSVCAKVGWLAIEEGGKLRKGFVDRWFLLWRDPKKAFEMVLLYYEAEDSMAPAGLVSLTVGAFTVAPPKSQRKGFPFTFRLETESPGQGVTKLILAAASAEEYGSWMAALNAAPSGAEPTSRQEAKQQAADRDNAATQFLAAQAPSFAAHGLQSTLEKVACGSLGSLGGEQQA